MLGIGLILNNNDYNNNNKIIFLTYILAPSCPDRIIIFEFEFSIKACSDSIFKPLMRMSQSIYFQIHLIGLYFMKK